MTEIAFNFNHAVLIQLYDYAERRLCSMPLAEARSEKQKYNTRLKRLMRKYDNLSMTATKRARKLAKEAESRIDDILLNAGDYQARKLPEIRAALRDTMSDFERRYSQELNDIQSEMFDLGAQTVFDPLEVVGASFGTPVISRATLEIAQGFSADLIQDVTSNALASINTEIATAVLTGRGVPEVRRAVKSILSGQSAGRYSALYRSEMIARTELARVHTLATNASFEKAKEFVPELQTEFRPNPTACEQCQPLKGVYEVGKAPDIPVHPNCQCVLLPFIPDLSDEQPAGYAAIDDIEQKIRYDKKETAAAYGINGEVGLSPKKGEYSSITFSDKELRRLKSVEGGVVMTHNHPSNAAFSHEDINMMYTIGAREERVISKDYLYVMRPGKGGRFNSANALNMQKKYKRHMDIVRPDYYNAIAEGKMSMEEAKVFYSNIVASNFADEVGIEYIRKKL